NAGPVQDYLAAIVAQHDRCHRPGIDPRRTDFRRGFCPDRRRSGNGHADDRAIYLRNGVFKPGPELRSRCSGIGRAWLRVVHSDLDPARDIAPWSRRMSMIAALSARRHRGQLHWTDVASYLYLAVGLVMMFGPVLWLVLSSFKTQAALLEFPPSLLPLAQKEVSVAGFDKPLPLFTVTLDDGSKKVMAQARRVGLQAQMVDPADPSQS